MRGLYAIVDTQSLRKRGLAPLPFAEALLTAEPAAIQLRDKGGDAGASLRLLRELKPRCANRRVPLYANDRPDLAALAGCDGVHLGQRDVPADLARRLFRQLGLPAPKIGVSVHNRSELSAALEQQPDYVALGPVFGTRSKQRPDPTLGLDGLDALLAELPMDDGPTAVAIGGLTPERSAAIADRCRAGAVIAGLLPDEQNESAPYDRVAELANELQARLSGAGYP